ncbi:hypothetical protein ACH4JS_12985 [Streptomyces sp. NPDC017638]|uniref:hypothetical protein n=1 Tax=Streptomyces sp. NPDC017638 TaxID=3365004 RepID=UPI0037AAFC79
MTAVLARTGPEALAERDLEQIALRLTVHARAVASGVRRRAAQLPGDSAAFRSTSGFVAGIASTEAVV